MNIPSRRSLTAVSLCLLMLLQIFVTVPVPTAGADGSRASSLTAWSTPIRILAGGNFPRTGELGVDSDGNLHYTWVNNTGTIFYGKMDSNGTAIGSSKVLGTSNRGAAANPRLSVDEGNLIHITWSNNSGPNLKRVFEYVRLNNTGAVLSAKHGIGGDNIIGYSTGFVVLQFFNDTRAFPDPYGPLSMLTYDLTGALVQNITVGYHKRDFEQASFLRNDTGSIFIVYMMDDTTMNTTVWKNLALPINQTLLLQGRTGMKCPRMSFDGAGNIQLVWIDGTPNAAYVDAGIWRMRLGTSGNVLAPAALLTAADRPAFRPWDLALLSSKGYDDFPVLARGFYTDVGSGGDQVPDSYFFIHVRSNGSLLETKIPLIQYCSGNTPAMVQTGVGLFSMFYGVTGCFHENGGPQDPPGLYFMRSYGYRFIDLSVTKNDLQYPDRTFPDEPFAFNVTVHNLGNWNTGDFILNLTNKATDQLVGNATHTLGPRANYTFEFLLDLQKPVTLLVTVDPLKNPDDNMSNNMVEVPITLIARPDLAIFSDNITFSNIRPNKGEVLELTAMISNLGGHDAGADVLFFDGVNGTRLGKTAVHFNTSSTLTSIFWAPANLGVRTIIVKITNVTPYELPGHSGNNEANRTLLVGSPTVPSVQIVAPAENAKIEIGRYNITGRAWDIDGDALQVFVRVDGGPWEQAATSPNTTIKGVDWFIKWDFSDTPEGNHTLAAQVKDDIHQNETLCHIHVVKYLVTITVLSWFPLKDPTINETQFQLFEVIVSNPHGLKVSYVWTLDWEIMNKTSKLNITTTYEASGIYNVTVTVIYSDLIWNHSWKLTVKDVNRPPVLTSHSPQNDTQILRYQTTQTFGVNVTDPDGDILNYTWTTGGKLINSSMGLARISFIDDGDYFVNVTVSDGRGGVVNHSWMVQVKRISPPCCLPPPKTHTYLEDMFLVGILVIGGIIIVLLAVIYIRYSRLSKGKKGKGETEIGDSPMEDELTPAGHIR